jgi:hypothetical protein
MDDNQLGALHLIKANGGQTAWANAHISFHAAALLKMGMIDYAPRRRAAYKLTPAGNETVRNALAVTKAN